MPNHPPYEQHTKMLMQMGRYEDAAFVASKWVEAFPNNGEAWFCKSASELQAGRAQDALASIERLLKGAPHDARYLTHKARTLVKLGRTQDGMKVACRLAKQPIENAYILNALGKIVSEAGDHELAIDLQKRAISKNATEPSFYTDLGTVLHFCRRTGEAEVAHKRALALNPKSFQTYWLLSQLRKATPERNHVESCKAALGKYGADAQARASIGYALGKQYEDLGEYKDAFASYQAGANAVLEQSPYSENAALEMFSLFKSQFDTKYMTSGVRGHESDEPIFIVGMPRTGTTLVERIIDTDTSVFAAGELHNFGHLLDAATATSKSAQSDAGQTLDLRRIDYAKLGQAYIESTRPRTGRTRYFIDKYPLNFQLLGPIMLALPKAKIVHLTRNPMDTCFSNFKLMFGVGTALYSYDLETLGRYYLAYADLMAHWKAVAPGRIHDVSYDALIANPEKETRALMDYLGLEWRPDTLEFYKSQDAVATPSTVQVRNPINASALNRWKKFETQLRPLLDLLQMNGVSTPK